MKRKSMKTILTQLATCIAMLAMFTILPHYQSKAEEKNRLISQCKLSQEESSLLQASVGQCLLKTAFASFGEKTDGTAIAKSCFVTAVDEADLNKTQTLCVKKIVSPIANLDKKPAPVASEPGLDPKPTTVWRSREEIDEIDDSAEVFVSAIAPGNGYDQKVLYARCNDNTTEVYIDWSDRLSSYVKDTNAHRVTQRFGDKPASNSVWTLSVSKTATFADKPIALLKQMLLVSSFTARTKENDGIVLTAKWDLEGFAEALLPLRTACNW